MIRVRWSSDILPGGHADGWLVDVLPWDGDAGHYLPDRGRHEPLAVVAFSKLFDRMGAIVTIPIGDLEYLPAAGGRAGDDR